MMSIYSSPSGRGPQRPFTVPTGVSLGRCNIPHAAAVTINYAAPTIYIISLAFARRLLLLLAIRAYRSVVVLSRSDSTFDAFRCIYATAARDRRRCIYIIIIIIVYICDSNARARRRCICSTAARVGSSSSSRYNRHRRRCASHHMAAFFSYRSFDHFNGRDFSLD
jgi:hypothetical protein